MEIFKRKPKSNVHPYIPELHDLYVQGKVSRREFLRYATLLGMSATAATALAACGGAATPAPAVATTAPAVATTAPAVATLAPTVAPMVMGPKRGGKVTIATRVQRVDHPARMSWHEAADQFKNVCEYLTYTQPDGITVPWLLEKWSASDDVKTWTLNVRKGVKFNDGADFTADDVVFNFQQWLDEAIGSSMLGLMGYLKPTGIEKVDDYTVKLNLDTAEIGVPEHLFQYPAMIVSKSFEGDITKQPVGTGCFTLTNYVPAERAEFKARTDYWRNGADGKPLPYLDEAIYLDLGEDSAAKIAALRSGQVDSIYSPSAEEWQAVKDIPEITVYSIDTATTYVIRMRSDIPPFDKVEVRQALKKCIDRQKMLDLAWFGEGVLGHDTHISPAHPEYCKKEIPAYDPEGAKKLLAAAGYPDGLTVELSTQQARAEPAMAQSLKETAAAGGFNIDLKILPSADYWNVWTEVPLGITIWLHRPLGTMIMQLGYTGDAEGKAAPWNESHWVDPEFDELIKQAAQTLDIEKRREIMCKAEDIQMERGSAGIAFFTKGWNLFNKKFAGISAHPTLWQMIDEAYIDA